MKTVKIITRKAVKGILRYNDKTNYAYLVLKKAKGGQLDHGQYELPEIKEIMDLMEAICIRSKWELWGHEKTYLPEQRIFKLTEQEIKDLYEVVTIGLKFIDSHTDNPGDKYLADRVEKIAKEKIFWS